MAMLKRTTRRREISEFNGLGPACDEPVLSSPKKGWMKFLQTLEGRRFTVFSYIFVTHIYFPLRNNYKLKYECDQGPENTHSEALKDPTSSTSIDLDEIWAHGAVPAVANLGAQRRISNAAGAPPARSFRVSSHWRWQSFPRIWRLLVWYRIFNSVWFVYVAVKFICPALLERPLLFFNMSKPPNCYLIGRFVLSGNVRYASGCFFALYHLSWRFFQHFTPCSNYMISTLYFLMLHDDDIKNYYELVERSANKAGQVGGKVQVGLVDDFKLAYKRYSGSWLTPPMIVDEKIEHTAGESFKRDKLLHDIMGYRVDQATGMTYRLRPNRTPEACVKLRNHAASITLLSYSIFAPLALVVAAILMITSYRTDRYIEDYPGCSPELEALHNNGSLNEHWHLNLRVHMLIALVADTIENAIIWSEDGLTGLFAISLTAILYYDLKIYWLYLDEKVERILGMIRRDAQLNSSEGQSPSSKNADSTEVEAMNQPKRFMASGTLIYRRNQHDKVIHELQMEWQDFIKQIERTDAFIGDGLSCFIVVWFSLFGFFIYDSLNRQTGGSLPVAINLTLIFVIAIVTSLFVGVLALHRYCLNTYPKICSLMAYDNSSYKLNFTQVMDYFIRKRICFSLLRRQRLTSTSYLTIVGWSFSCFFILGTFQRY